MNYKRGALRAWLVFSLIWIASTFVATWAVQNQHESNLTKTDYTLSKYGGAREANVFMHTLDTHMRMTTQNGHRAVLPILMPIAEKQAALKVIDLYIADRTPRKALSVKTLLIAFSFPLFSIALGFAFLWVWRGFTK